MTEKHCSTAPKPARTTRSSRHEREGISFYEGSARVKSPAAGFGFTVFSSFSFLQTVFALVGPVHLRVRARCARHHLLSVSAFLPSTRCCMRPKRARRTGFRTRRPIYQDGRAHGTAQEIHGRLDQPSTLQAPVVDCLAAQISEAMSRAPWGITPSSRVRHSAISNFLAKAIESDAAHAQAPAGEARLIPLGKGALWLETQPQPGDFHDHGAHPAIARLG